MTQESATIDETLYFGLGKYLLQSQRWDVLVPIGHPPLSYYLNSLPFLFANTDPNLWNYSTSGANDPQLLANIRRGSLLLASSANQGDRLLTQSRLMMVSVAVLLGWFVYSWSYLLYGERSAILASVLYTCCPNMLANSHLITPDITVTAFVFITVYFLWKFLGQGRRRDAIAGGVCLGLALLSKFTGLLLLPICLGLTALWWTMGRRIDFGGCLLFISIGLAVLWLGYGMHLGPYFYGIAWQKLHASLGHGSFLMGRYSKSGWWYYLIIAFLLKTPIAGLVLLAISMFCLLARAPTGPWMDEAFLLLPAAIVFAFFSVNHLSLGLRYLLPIYPFLFVLASEAAGSTRLKSWRSAGLMVVLVGWYVGASWSIHPHYLAYFNEFVGGPANGYKYLVDSNLDWGQDLKGLKSYMQEQSIPKIGLSYFGTDSPQRYGISYSWLPSYPFLENPNPAQHGIAPGGWVAISATNLQGVYFENKALFAWLKTRQPEAMIGYSIFVYHLNP